MKYKLADRTVAITGAAGGLGSALAAAVAERGARVALMDVDVDALAEQADRVGDTSRVRAFRADVRSVASVETAMCDAARHFGRLDVVIACAGVADPAEPLWQMAPDAWERTIDVNLNGVWRTFRAGMPYVQQQRGHLLAVSSMAAFVHSPLQGAYTASKAGVWALCNTIRLEAREVGVTVGSVHPTFFKSPMMDAASDEAAVRRLYNDFRGMWKFESIDTVVNDIVRGIERRSRQIVTPRSLWLSALAPGIAQSFVDRFGYRGNTVEEAMRLAERKPR